MAETQAEHSAERKRVDAEMAKKKAAMNSSSSGSIKKSTGKKKEPTDEEKRREAVNKKVLPSKVQSGRDRLINALGG